MPTTSGRKPHTAYGDVGIMTLTIDGPINAENRGITNENEKQCSLKQNQNLILGRGSEEYILSLREGTLEASTVNWIIPQPWDREWSFQRGGVFSPTQCEIADCKVALISETMQRPADGTAKASSWGDFSDNNFEFTAEASTEPTLEADTTKKFFNNVTGSSSNDLSLITNYAAVGDNLNIDVSANNFAVVFFIKTDSATSGEQCILSFGKGNTQGCFQVSTRNGSTLRIRSKGTGSLNTVDSSSVLSTNSYYTIVVGTTNGLGTAFARVNGTDVGLSGTIDDVTLSSSMPQINLLCRENSGSYGQNFNGDLYEFYWLKSSTVDNSFLSEIEKIEGGLAQKYDTLGDLPADHTYKTKVPHGSPIKHAPDRFG